MPCLEAYEEILYSIDVQHIPNFCVYINRNILLKEITDVKKLVALFLSLTFVLVLVGCDQPKAVTPEVDLVESFNECWPGTIADIFTEGSGADLAEVIELEIKDHDPMYFTIIKETEYLRYYSDIEETEEIAKMTSIIGAWVEIDCESYYDSGYHSIFTIKVIEPTK